LSRPQERPKRVMSASWRQEARTVEVVPENTNLRCHSYCCSQIRPPSSSDLPHNDDDAKKARKSFPRKSPGRLLGPTCSRADWSKGLVAPRASNVWTCRTEKRLGSTATLRDACLLLEHERAERGHERKECYLMLGQCRPYTSTPFCLCLGNMKRISPPSTPALLSGLPSPCVQLPTTSSNPDRR
jgi:hypothetical protein